MMKKRNQNTSSNHQTPTASNAIEMVDDTKAEEE